MFKKIALVLLVLGIGPHVWAQTTSVSGTVTDAAAVIWRNGTYSFTFLPSPTNPTANYFQNGVPFSKNQVLTGALDNTGSFTSVAVPDNMTIVPAGSNWTLQVCSLATASNGCFRTNLTITGATQNVTSALTPPAIVVDLGNPPPGGPSAYIDGEIFGARVGNFYFNLTDNTAHFCEFPACNWVSIGGTFSGTVSNGQIVYGNGANSLASTPNFLWNQAGQMANLINTTPATAIANQSSPILQLQGSCWNGASATPTIWTFQDVVTAGTNPTDSLTLNGTGCPGGIEQLSLPFNLLLGKSATGSSIITLQGAGSGQGSLQANTNAGSPQPLAIPTTNPVSGQYIQGTNSGPPSNMVWVTPAVQCGALATNAACANTLTVLEHCVSGTAALTAGASTITGISPAFTSTSSFTVITNDTTTISNPSKGVPASVSSITFTGTGTDVLNFVACGG